MPGARWNAAATLVSGPMADKVWLPGCGGGQGLHQIVDSVA